MKLKMIATNAVCILLLSLQASFASYIHSYPYRDLHYTVGHSKKVACYFESWSVFRDGSRKFEVERINAYLCTHVIYAFAGLSPENKIKSLNPYLDIGLKYYERFNNLKLLNPNLKTLISVGGWNEGSLRYSLMAENTTKRATFVASVVDFLKTHNFDGLDLAWEYPGSRGGKDEDKKNFLLLLKELKEEFNSNGFLLSICGAAIKETIDRGYDVPEIMNYVDWVNLVTYDYYTSFDNMTGPNSPLFGKLYDSWETFHKNVNYTIHYWLQKGAHREKLLMGLAAYGQGFNLKDPTIHGFDAPIFSKGTEGPLMDAPRAFGFNEICKKIKFETWTVIEDPYTMTAYMYKGHQWISFDNLNGISYKAVYSRYLQLAGVVVWSIDVDDFEGECNDLKNPFTLLQRVNSVFDLIDTKLPINIVDPKTSESRINSTTTSTNPLPTKQPLDNHITKSSTTTSQTSISSTISTLTSTPSTTTSTNTEFSRTTSTSSPFNATSAQEAITESKWSTSSTTSNTILSSHNHTKSHSDVSTHQQNKSSTVDNEFVCSYSGTFKHPKSCKKFYVCIYRGESEKGPKFIAYEYDCPDHTSFDANMNTCVWTHENVRCSNTSELEQLF